MRDNADNNFSSSPCSVSIGVATELETNCDRALILPGEFQRDGISQRSRVIAIRSLSVRILQKRNGKIQTWLSHHGQMSIVSWMFRIPQLKYNKCGDALPLRSKHCLNTAGSLPAKVPFSSSHNAPSPRPASKNLLGLKYTIELLSQSLVVLSVMMN